MKDLETVIREVVDAKAEQDNQVDLNTYENGIRDFIKASNYIHCCETLLNDIEIGRAISELSGLADKESEK